MSRRNEQIASLLKAQVQGVFSRGFQDPRIRGLVTVTSVDVVDSGRVAVIRVSVLPEKHEELTLHGLKAAAKHVRHEVSDRVAMRSVPELRFEIDRGLRNQRAVFEALGRERDEQELEGTDGASDRQTEQTSGGDER